MDVIVVDYLNTKMFDDFMKKSSVEIMSREDAEELMRWAAEKQSLGIYTRIPMFRFLCARYGMRPQIASISREECKIPDKGTLLFVPETAEEFLGMKDGGTIKAFQHYRTPSLQKVPEERQSASG